MTAIRPCGRSSRTAAGSASSSCAELVVDRDPQCLEDALGRMALAEASRRRDGGLDHVDKLARADERLAPAAANDGTRDLPRVPLLAVAAEDLLQLALRCVVDDVGRGLLGGGIHAHVERRVDRVRESALGAVELHAGDAEVEQDGVDADVVRRQLVEDGRELAAQEPRLDAGALAEALEVLRVPTDRGRWR